MFRVASKVDGSRESVLCEVLRKRERTAKARCTRGGAFRDSLHEVQVPEIEPRFVKKAWKEHRKTQKQYLSWLAETEVTEPQQTGELDGKGEGEGEGEPSHFPTS